MHLNGISPFLLAVVSLFRWLKCIPVAFVWNMLDIYPLCYNNGFTGLLFISYVSLFIGWGYFPEDFRGIGAYFLEMVKTAFQKCHMPRPSHTARIFVNSFVQHHSGAVITGTLTVFQEIRAYFPEVFREKGALPPLGLCLTFLLL